MSDLQPIHFVPPSRQAEILAHPVNRILAVQHSKIERTNHWCLYLSTSPSSSVQIDCQPGYTLPSTVVLQGGSKANLIIAELDSECPRDAQAVFALDVVPGISVGLFVAEITRHGRQKYGFDAEGVGCRWWTTDLIDLLYRLRVIGDASQVAAAKAGILKLWPDQTYLLLDQ